MCTYRHDDDDDVDAIKICRISESVELFTNIDITSKTETYIMSESKNCDRHDDDHDAIQNCRMSESVELCAHVDMRMMMLMPFKNAECQDP